MKHGICGIIVFTVAIAAHAQEEKFIDSIAAVVNENIILVSEFENELDQVRERLRNDEVGSPPESELRKQVLESLISHELQLNEAEKRGIEVDDLALNETIRDIASRNADSLEQFRRQLEADGTSYARFREDIRKELTVRHLFQQVINNRVVITEQEIDDYIGSQDTGDDSQYLLSHIQVAVPEDANVETEREAEQKAESIYQRLITGEDFSQLAVSQSDARNALEGGDLGWRRLGELPPQFAGEVRNLTVGDISKPFSTPRGFHILKLHDTRGVTRNFVKQVQARHILISPDALNDNDDVRRQLSDIRNRILDGADFEALAKQYSDDTGSAPQGGKMDWTDPNQYAPEFRNVINELPTGKISEPFKTPYGWHIVEVLGWRNHDNTNEQRRASAQQTLYRRKAQQEEELWLRQLRDEAYVDIRINL